MSLDRASAAMNLTSRIVNRDSLDRFAPYNRVGRSSTSEEGDEDTRRERQARAPGTYRQEAIRAEVAWLESRTVYRVLGDALWWLLTLAILGMSFRSAPPWARGKPGNGPAESPSTS